MNQRSLFEDVAGNAGPRSDPPPVFECDRCGFDRFVDVPIHNGQSVRRDCARCKRTLGFPVWYGRSVGSADVAGGVAEGRGTLPPQNSRDKTCAGDDGQGNDALQKNDRPPGLVRN
jgi:hypothetical protein